MATISDERLAEIEEIVALIVKGGDCRLYDAESKVPLPFKLDTLHSILTELQSLRSQAGVSEAVVANEPVAFVSPEQFEDHGDPLPEEEPFGGLYLPVRLTRAGNFTMPLYARPATIEITEEMVERAAKAILYDRFGNDADAFFEPVPDAFPDAADARRLFARRIAEANSEARAALTAALELDKQPISSHIQPSDGQTP